MPSRTVTIHLVRGVLAALLIAWAWYDQGSHTLLAVAAFVTAIVFLGGCPTCWLVGLFETVGRRRTPGDDSQAGGCPRCLTEASEAKSLYSQRERTSG
jgi:hypothetical protein